MSSSLSFYHKLENYHIMTNICLYNLYKTYKNKIKYCIRYSSNPSRQHLDSCIEPNPHATILLDDSVQRLSELQKKKMTNYIKYLSYV